MITTEVIVDALKDRFLEVTTLTREAESKEYIGITADYVSVFPLGAVPRPKAYHALCGGTRCPRRKLQPV